MLFRRNKAWYLRCNANIERFDRVRMILDKTCQDVAPHFLLHTCTNYVWDILDTHSADRKIYARCSFLFEFCRCPRYTSGAKQDRFIVLGIFWPSLERRRRPHERRRQANPVPPASVLCRPTLPIREYPVSPLWDCANWKKTFFPSTEHVDSRDSLAFFARLFNTPLYSIETFPRHQMRAIR